MSKPLSLSLSLSLLVSSPHAVELQLEGGEQQLAVRCALGDSVESVKERVCGEWGLSAASVSLSYNGQCNI